MRLYVPCNFPWPPPWKPYPLPRGWFGKAVSAEAELQAEVCPAHPLYRVGCEAVAWNAADPNEFLFVTSNPEMPLAFVHLTWKAEHDPAWPYTVGYAGWDEFRSAWLEADE